MCVIHKYNLAHNKRLRATFCDLHKQCKCPLTKKPLDDPVTAEDGYIYEEANIKEWLSINTTSPVTKQKMGGQLFPSFSMKALQQHCNKYLALISKDLHVRTSTQLIHQNKTLENMLNDCTDEFICPIDQTLPLYPVIASDGFLYNQKSIQTSNSLKPAIKSPITNQEMAKWLYSAKSDQSIIRILLRSKSIKQSRLPTTISDAEYRSKIIRLHSTIISREYRKKIKEVVLEHVRHCKFGSRCPACFRVKMNGVTKNKVKSIL